MFPAGQRLMAAPGMGVLTATALVAAVGHAAEFRNGRQMPAWLRLVARQRWTDGRSTLLGISKRDDAYPRTILIHGAGSSMRLPARRTNRRNAGPITGPGPLSCQREAGYVCD